METRKVQLTGGSSYIITLPIEWIRSMKITKNSSLSLKYQPGGGLLILPQPSEENRAKELILDADKIQDPTFLFRCLVGSYIAGYTAIKIMSTDRLLPSARKAARDFTIMTVGQQIVDETDSSIVIKDLLNPGEMPFEKSLKRMYVIIKTMYQDVLIAIETKDTLLAQDIINRDNEVDKLQWLISRQYHLLLHDPNLGEKMQVTMSQALNFFVVSRILERVGDHGVRIAQHLINIFQSDVDSSIVSNIVTSTKLAMQILDSSIYALFSGDLVKANDTIGTVEKLEGLSDAIASVALQKKGSLALSLGYIAESIRRAGEYAADVSETSINQLIEENKGL
jgi:phosphate uptake regulator